MKHFAETLTYSGHFEGAAAFGIVALIGVVLFVLLAIVMLPALIIAAVARRHAERIRNNRVSTIVVQYDPPHGFSPAQIGLLYDMRCGQLELLATLFDLEQRGIVKLIDNNTVEIIDQAAYDSLAEYEKIAIRLAKGETSSLEAPRIIPFNVTDANGATYKYNLPLPHPKSLRAFSKAVQRSIVDRGIPMRSFALSFIKRSLIVAIIIGLLPVLMVALPGNYNGETYNAWSVTAFNTSVGTAFVMAMVFWPIYLGLAMFLTWMWTKIAGRYWINTPQARALWPELEGYRLYLNQVDLDNIQFESADHSSTPTTKTLPYAMAFGLDTRWKTRLRGVSAKLQP